MKTQKQDKIEQIMQGVWAIDDEKGCSLYLIEGSDQAVLIDTGMAERKLLPVLRQLTKKPIVLILTHAHLDHMYHEAEFDEVYIHEVDKRAWRWPLSQAMYVGAKLMFHVPAKTYHVKRYHSLQDASSLHIGGLHLNIILAQGHTPGSILIVDETHKLIFTGDAFGSGSGAWMWLPGSLKTSAYRESLSKVLKQLRPYEKYRMLPGHRHQGKPLAQGKDAYLLDMRLVEHMNVLCDRILAGNCQAVPFSKGVLHLQWYHYETAGMLITKRKRR